MTVEKCRPLLVEAWIHKKKKRDAQRKARLILPQLTRDPPDYDGAQPSPEYCKDLPVHRNLRNNSRGKLIKHAPDWAIHGEILSQRLRTQLITNPGYGQIVPVKAHLWNQQTVCKYGNHKEEDGRVETFHKTGHSNYPEQESMFLIVSNEALLSALSVVSAWMRSHNRHNSGPT